MQIVFDPGLTRFLWSRPPQNVARVHLIRKTTIKDLIESEGVPHTEVGAVYREDTLVSMEEYPDDSDILTVRPIAPPIKPLTGDSYRSPLSEIRFLVDACVARLAKDLRLLGFDCFFKNHIDDLEVAERAKNERRIVLTRDRGLLFRKDIEWGQYLNSDDHSQQTSEVIERFGLHPHFKVFTRCLECNGSLKRVDKKDVLDQLKPLTQKYFDEFIQCGDCSRVYWKGSHFKRLTAELSQHL